MVLSPGVRSVGKIAFGNCEYLWHVDLRAASGLRALGEATFQHCKSLEQLLLNKSLEVLGKNCFGGAGLRSFVAPASLREVGTGAFSDSRLERADFSACLQSEEQQRCARNFLGDGAFRNSDLEDVRLPRALRAIGREAFRDCERLRGVALPDLLEEIRTGAFQGSGLESFSAPASLKQIDELAFGECYSLKDFWLNDRLQRLGYLCLWRAEISAPMLPPQIRMTPEQLGFQDPKVLRLPQGLEAVEESWFERRDIEKLFVASSVRSLGECAFAGCSQLREVVFEAGSRLESIGDDCFAECGFASVTIPRSVRTIGREAFLACQELSSVAFEEGSLLGSVGQRAFCDTQLGLGQQAFPNGVKEDVQEENQWPPLF